MDEPPDDPLRNTTSKTLSRSVVAEAKPHSHPAPQLLIGYIGRRSRHCRHSRDSPEERPEASSRRSRHAPTPEPEETSDTSLTFTMSRHSTQGHDRHQYQLVTPGQPADPRAMSQVSPGFIFVNFLCLCAAFASFSLPISSILQSHSFVSSILRGWLGALEV